MTRTSMNTRAIAILAGALVFPIQGPQVFASDPPKTVAEMAVYQGPDRHDLLVAAAKKEGGEMSVYHVYPSLPSIITAFTNKYGIKVKAWRSGSEGVLQKVVSEAKGN